jgi:hypothetical protein
MTFWWQIWNWSSKVTDVCHDISMPIIYASILIESFASHLWIFLCFWMNTLFTTSFGCDLSWSVNLEKWCLDSYVPFLLRQHIVLSMSIILFYFRKKIIFLDQSVFFFAYRNPKHWNFKRRVISVIQSTLLVMSLELTLIAFTLGSWEQGEGRGLKLAAEPCLINSLHRSACKNSGNCDYKAFFLFFANYKAFFPCPFCGAASSSSFYTSHDGIREGHEMN